MTAVNQTFSEIITFTRASTGTFVGSNGLVQTAAIDVPRFDYNPTTLAAQGFLVEESRANLALYSEQFDNAAWTKNATSITPDVITSPNGALNADRLVENTATASHSMQQSFSVTSGVACTVSVYVKSTERFATLGLSPNATFGGTGATGFFNISNGTVRSAVGTVTALITAVGDGWYRCSITATPTATGTANAAIGLSASGTAQSYTGDGTSGLYFWGAQIETGAFPTSYIPTTTATVTRAADESLINTLSPWYNATEGTLFAQAVPLAAPLPTAARNLFRINDVANTSSIDIRYLTSQKAGFVVVSASTPQADLTTTNDYSSAVNKLSGAYKALDFAVGLNGVTPVASTTGSVPTGLTSARLGWDGTNYFSGYLQKIIYYPQRLTNAELQSLTA